MMVIRSCPMAVESVTDDVYRRFDPRDEDELDGVYKRCVFGLTSFVYPASVVRRRVLRGH